MQIQSRKLNSKEVVKIEFEYIRNGNQSLIVNWHIAKGLVITL